LFQYFTGLEIAKQISGNLILDTSLLPAKAFINRTGTSVFPDAIKFEHVGEKKRGVLHRWLPEKFALFVYARVAQLNRIRSFCLSLLGVSNKYLTDETSVKLDSVSRTKQDITVQGLCLTSEPLLEIPKLQLLSLVHPVNPSRWFLVHQKLIESVRPVAIHIRLGDHSRLGETVDVDYIKRAIAWTESNTFKGEVWVFSDEPKRVKDILSPISKNFKIIDAPEECEPIESLVLMSQAPVLVMARSTFSFWAARLGSALGNVSILNKQWLEESNPPAYLKGLDQTWIQL
jgi:hypothetical protein